jgi:lysophospholipase L1-like esterase
MNPHRPAFFLALIVALPAFANPILKNGDTIALCGDSLTEQREYSVFVESYLLAAKPARDLRIVELGWSSELLPAFAPRIASDILPFHPTLATVFYGNDGHYPSLTPQIQQTFSDALKSSIDTLKTGGVRTILLASPAAVDTTPFQKRLAGNAASANQSLSDLTDLTQSVARQSDVPFINIHAPMMDLMAQSKTKYGPRFAFGGADGIHPGGAGQIVIAYALLKSLGCDGDLGTITLDLASGHNHATGGHRILGAADGKIQIQSGRIPFCFFGDNTASSERSMIDLLPFNDQLNRLTLKVVNAGPGNLRITWAGAGDANQQSKDFSSDDLIKGINLAAEFPDNPFSAAFDRIEKLVRTQQEFETPLVKALLHSIPVEKQIIPEESATLDRLMTVALAHDKALFDAAAAEAAKPVEHSIKIEPVP